MRLFWGWYFYDYIDWEKKRPRGQIDWQTSAFPLKAGFSEIVDNLVEDYYAFLRNALVTKWKAKKREVQTSDLIRESSSES